MSRNKPSTSMTNLGCISKLHTIVRPSLHSCAGNWVAIGLAFVYYARTARAFSAEIKCRHCTCPANGLAIGRLFVYYARAAHAFSEGIKCRHCRLFFNYLVRLRRTFFPLTFAHCEYSLKRSQIF